ncbi:MAG TPA: ATP-binding protein [Planctomycetota bacterium]|nr:ATP-binding protein [Planctomycetota bacterium]
MNNGMETRRFALIAAGATLGVVAAGLLVAHLFSVSESGRLAVAIASLVAAAGVTAFVATRGGSGAGPLRDLARKIKPGSAGADPLRDVAEGIDGLLAKIRELEAAVERARKEAAEASREGLAALERDRARLLAAQEISHVGSWDWDPVQDRVTASDELARIYGLKPGEFPSTLAAWMERLHPSEGARVRAELEACAKSGAPFTHEERIVRPGGEGRDLLVWGRARLDGAGRVVGLGGAAQDITDVRRAERDLAARARDLERSNADLEQFAYAASHDLQEPLRMVASYVTLLARRYRGKLDRDADEFIAFAVDGAERMQKLIRDLLTYSRVTRTGRPMEPVDLGQTLRTAMTNLKVALDDSGACVTAEPLPTVKGDATGLTALIQNLLANAIKFRGERPPTIHLGVERRGDEWTISVRDDGVGFDPQQAGRLFVIFQRLHGSDKYEGSGIGLAICRKIVERHGGRIWAEANPAGGATFHFTLPVAGKTVSNPDPKIESQVI